MLENYLLHYTINLSDKVTELNNMCIWHIFLFKVQYQQSLKIALLNTWMAVTVICYTDVMYQASLMEDLFPI